MKTVLIFLVIFSLSTYKWICDNLSTVNCQFNRQLGVIGGIKNGKSDKSRMLGKCCIESKTLWVVLMYLIEHFYEHSIYWSIKFQLLSTFILFLINQWSKLQKKFHNKQSSLDPKMHYWTKIHPCMIYYEHAKSQNYTWIYPNTWFIIIANRCSISHHNNYFSLNISLPVFICQLMSVKSRVYCIMFSLMSYMKSS